MPSCQHSHQKRKTTNQRNKQPSIQQLLTNELQPSTNDQQQTPQTTKLTLIRFQGYASSSSHLLHATTFVRTDKQLDRLRGASPSSYLSIYSLSVMVYMYIYNMYIYPIYLPPTHTLVESRKLTTGMFRSRTTLCAYVWACAESANVRVYDMVLVERGGRNRWGDVIWSQAH